MVVAHLAYTGIVSFWKDSDEGRVWVLAPKDPGGGHGVKQHVAWAWCYDKQVVDSDTTLQPFKRDRATERSAYKIEGFLQFSGGDRTPLVSWQESGGYDPSNLVPLSDSHPNGPTTRVKLNRNLVDPGPDTKTAFKTVIDRGKLDISYIDLSEKWRYKGAQAGSARSLAEEVCNRVTLDSSNTLTLSLAPDKKLVLRSVSGEDIILMIGNTPEDDIFNPPNVHQHEDHHVKLYVDLASRPHGNRRPLVRVRGNEKSRRIHGHEMKVDTQPVTAAVTTAVHGANCPPGWWEEDEGG